MDSMYKKRSDEIEHLIEGGKFLGEILSQLVSLIVPGARADDIDAKAEKMIRAVGGIPAFKGYQPHPSDRPFPGTICFSLNDEVVHGIPTKEKEVRIGDLVSIDIGMLFPSSEFKVQSFKDRGLYTDTAITLIVGEVPEKVKKLVAVTKEALEVGIRAAIPGNTIADIGKAIEMYVQSKGSYGIVRDLVGHGVGHRLHEEPRIPNYYDPALDTWEIVPGAVLALEPMITLGSYNVETALDGWSISTRDKSLSAHFEHTVVVTEKGPVVVTRRPEEYMISPLNA